MKKFLKFLKYFLLAAVAVIVIVASVFIAKGYSMYKRALRDTPPEDVIEKITSDPDFTPLSELPDTYKKAVIAAEDHRFYYHGGVDLISVARAVYVNVTRLKLVEGGSSITQQFVKNAFFSQARTAERKIAETFMALYLERRYEKDDILSWYVNTIYFGSGYYSIRAAARGYYGKEPSELDDYESTMLAGLPNAPSVYSLDAHPDLAAQRQAQVVRKMIKYGYLTQQQGEEILSRNA